MSRGETKRAKPITLDQLVALNDEIAALIRAGIPLELGLRELGLELPGRLGQMATTLSQRLSSGESLPEIMASDEKTFPPVWRAVVEAGIRSGSLSAALEGLSTTVRRVAEFRRAVGLALIYPLIVLGLAYGLFVFLTTKLAPVMLDVYQDLTSKSDAVLATLVWLGENTESWALWIPGGVALLLGIWWYRSGRVAWIARRSAKYRVRGTGTSRWPTSARLLREGRMASFAEVLSLLVEQQVALPDAVTLAAEASGDPALVQAAQQVAERLQRGEVITARSEIPAAFPPLLGWLIATGTHQAGLSQALRRAAAVYRERAARSAAWMIVYLPIAMTAIVGSTAALVQAIMIFGPICKLLYDLR